MTDWHRLFGLVLTDFFTDSSYRVELEKDLSLKQQFVDVVIIEQGDGQSLTEVPDGFDNLGPHNVLSYKSHQESFTAWACDELIGHYVNYRKQMSPAMDKLLPEDFFRLYGVSTRFPQKLSETTPFQEVVQGVYDITWGSQILRLIVLSQIHEIPRNSVWQLFSAQSDHVAYGASHYQWHIQHLSTILYDLYQQYRVEGITMSYTVNDYYRDFTREHLDWLTPEERVKDLLPEERVKGLPPEDVFKQFPPEERLKGLPPEERLKGLSSNEIIRLLCSDEVKANISEEQFEQLLQQFRHE